MQLLAYNASNRKYYSNTVGVDIGCGMVSCRFDKKIDKDFLPQFDKKIRQIFPIGNSKGGVNKNSVIDLKKTLTSKKLTIFTFFCKKI
jgi:hypothetical protein